MYSILEKKVTEVKKLKNRKWYKEFALKIIKKTNKC